MQVKLWDEGVSWSCLPQAVISMVFLGASAFNSWWVLAGLGLLLTLLFLAARTGVQWQVHDRKFRSTTGWKVARIWRGWGRWYVPPINVPLSLEHTKETLMNRRGAYDVGIESWELVWHRSDGLAQVLHEFTDHEVARKVKLEIEVLLGST